MPLAKYTDSELISLLSKDNEQAFRVLYDRYWQRMLLKAYDRLGSYADAEEVVQDSFINLWNRRHRLKITYSFHTYFAAVVRYEVMAKLARRRNKEHEPIDEQQAMRLADDSTEQWLDFMDLSRQIEEAVHALPERCQMVFRLSRDKGLTEKQISEDLQISIKTVEAHMSKAIKTIRAALNQLFTLFIVFLLIFMSRF